MSDLQTHHRTFSEIHSYVFFVAWNVFTIVSIATARYNKHNYETNMLLHAAVGSLILVVSVIWGLMHLKMLAQLMDPTS